MLCLTLIAGAQPAGRDSLRRHAFRIAELNCENLFDTIHTEGHDDYEFLPSAQRKWNSPKYLRKLSMLAREIAAIGQDQPADIIALTEVETDTVLRDLTQRTNLSQLRYHHIITHGSDPRGINVALLYMEGSFRPLRYCSLNWQERTGLTLPTRDALHVSGIARSGDTLDIIVCHMPSQIGKRGAARRRKAICSSLRAYTDSIFAHNPRANIILIGDFNIRPNDKSLLRNLRATLADSIATARHNHGPACPQLYNISNLRPTPKRMATYRFKGHWEMLDQCIVSCHLLQPTARHCLALSSLRVANLSFLLEADRKYGGKNPWRTWQGPFYHGGFSDHLPLVVDFEYLR